MTQHDIDILRCKWRETALTGDDFEKLCRQASSYLDNCAKAALCDKMEAALVGLLAQNDRWSQRPESGLPPLKETSPESIARAVIAEAKRLKERQ